MDLMSLLCEKWEEKKIMYNGVLCAYALLMMVHNLIPYIRYVLHPTLKQFVSYFFYIRTCTTEGNEISHLN